MADTYWGRYKTIHVAICFAMVGHVILTASAAPSVIKNGSSALAAFTIGLVILGIGTGGFKSNISPLLAEQQTDNKKRIETLPSGERVIVDPAVTTSRIFLYFYMCIVSSPQSSGRFDWRFCFPMGSRHLYRRLTI